MTEGLKILLHLHLAADLHELTGGRTFLNGRATASHIARNFHVPIRTSLRRSRAMARSGLSRAAAERDTGKAQSTQEALPAGAPRYIEPGPQVGAEETAPTRR